MDAEKCDTTTEAPVDAEQTDLTESPIAPKVCLNCDTPLTDVYCAHCGQKDIPLKQTIGELLTNFISSFWSFESKFLRTGKLLLFHPGKLVVDYNAGKRERYYHPARMYVFISFVYFLLLTTLPDASVSHNKGLKFSVASSDDEKINFRFNDFHISGEIKSKNEYDSMQHTLPPEQRDGYFKRKLQYRVIDLNNQYSGRKSEFSKMMREAFVANTSKTFFLLLPLFALLLKLFYINKNYFYSEHLVFSIYYYNFFFLTGSLYLLWDLIPFLNKISWLLIVWIMVYLFFAMKRAYPESGRITFVKFIGFALMFSICILAGQVLNLMYTLMFT